MTFSVYTGAVPSVTGEQMAEVDRAMLEDYHIALVQMMENAGRHLAHLARERFLAGDARGQPVVVLAGTGGNGGGALVSARRLQNWGASVQVVLSRPAGRLGGVPAQQLDSLQRMRVPVVEAGALETLLPPALIIDGLIGYRLTGAPRDAAADLIRWANAQPGPILALDLPSGVEATTGSVYEPAIRARATLTLALPKTGLHGAEATAHVGELYLADISVPPELYARPPLGLHVGRIFARSEIVRLP